MADQCNNLGDPDDFPVRIEPDRLLNEMVVPSVKRAPSSKRDLRGMDEQRGSDVSVADFAIHPQRVAIRKTKLKEKECAGRTGDCGPDGGEGSGSITVVIVKMHKVLPTRASHREIPWSMTPIMMWSGVKPDQPPGQPSIFPLDSDGCGFRSIVHQENLVTLM